MDEEKIRQLNVTDCGFVCEADKKESGNTMWFGVKWLIHSRVKRCIRPWWRSQDFYVLQYLPQLLECHYGVISKILKVRVSNKYNRHDIDRCIFMNALKWTILDQRLKKTIFQYSNVLSTCNVENYLNINIFIQTHLVVV